MPRGQERQIVGGQLAPSVTEGFGARRTGKENRILEAMRQGGATQRTGMQAQTQIAGAQIGARSRQEITAMELAERDRRAAEAVNQVAADREFRKNQLLLEQQLMTDREKAVALRERAYKETDDKKAREDMKKAEMRTLVADAVASRREDKYFQLAVRTAGGKVKGREDVAKIYQTTKAANDKARERMKMMEILGKDVDDSITVNDWISEEEERKGHVTDLLKKDYSKMGLSDTAVSLFTNADFFSPWVKTKIENKIAEGEITGGDLQKLKIVLDKRYDWTKEKIEELKTDEGKLTTTMGGVLPSPVLSEGGKLLKKRKEEAVLLDKIRSTIEGLEQSKVPMRDLDQTVGKYVKGRISEMRPVLREGLQELLEAEGEDINKTIKELTEFKAGPDWDELTQSFESNPNLSEKEKKHALKYLGIHRMIDSGGVWGAGMGVPVTDSFVPPHWDLTPMKQGPESTNIGQGIGE